MSPDLQVERIPSRDHRLGRHIVHDEASRLYPAPVYIDKSTWVSRYNRIYDPTPNPNQCHGECTFVAKCMQFNAVLNRVKGVVLKMDTAHKGYSLATSLDIWDGSWPPDDTGSSGIASARAAQQLGLGGTYRWLFGGADQVVQAVMNGHVVSVGTRWYDGMFDRDSKYRIEPTGAVAGGHQYVIRGYRKADDMVVGRCWWGNFRGFYMKRSHLHDLLMDDGDAHIQERLGATG